MKKIVVVGAGTMGNGIAHVFAQNGYHVRLVDVSESALQRGMQTIEKNLDRMLAKGSLTEADKTATLGRVTPHLAIDRGLADADLVVEAATERVELKLDIFRSLDKIVAPEAILASNTSSISIGKIASASLHPQRVIGMHFMNPVPVMKLVEIIKGYNTSDEVAQRIRDLSVALGKIPVLVHDYPGFVANRILMPMINEAIQSLFEGVAGVEEIDQVMKLGMAHPMGPLQLADFIGLDVCLAILRVLQEGLGQPKYAPCPLLVNMVTAGHLGVKSGSGFYEYTPGSKEVRVAARFQ
ncbi:MAG: 3-hydroxybutyryl-CoA dehydrogenase [Sphingomonadales bacterium]|nr:3-hydroxybutyryl-CoA dehydrogenase [Sphingomonadales bacterium]